MSPNTAIVRRRISSFIKTIAAFFLTVVSILIVSKPAYAADWESWDKVELEGGGYVRVSPDKSKIYLDDVVFLQRGGVPFGQTGAWFAVKVKGVTYYFRCISPDNTAPRPGSILSAYGYYSYTDSAGYRHYQLYTNQNGDIWWYERNQVHSMFGVWLAAWSQKLTGSVKLKFAEYGQLSISKEVVGETEKTKGREFTFDITLKDRNGSNVNATYSYTGTGGKANGKLVFKNGKATLTLKKGESITTEKKIPAGYTYTVTERESVGFTSKITGGSGTIKGNNTSKVTDTNTYDPKGTWQIKAKKRLDGQGEILEGEYKFTLRQNTADGKVLQTAYAAPATAKGDKNEVDTTVTFAPINYTSADIGKTYTYVVKEENTGIGGHTYSDSTYTYSFTIVDDGTGVLKCEYTDTSETGIKEFTNVYEAHGSEQITVRKELKGRKLQANEFQFELRQGSVTGPIVADATNDANGYVRFPAVSYNQDDVDTNGNAKITYFVVERDKDDPSLDKTEWPRPLVVEVSLRDDRKGNIESSHRFISDDTTPDSMKDVAVNKLKTGNLIIKKTAKGETSVSKDAKFTFKLKLTDKNGAPLDDDYEYRSSDTEHGEQGTIHNGGTFSIGCNETITIYKLPVETQYEFIETNIPKGWTLVEEDSENLSGSIPLPSDGSPTVTTQATAVAVNQYEAHGSVLLEGWKVLKGEALKNEQFSFHIYDDAACTHAISEELKNDVSGLVAYEYKFDQTAHGKTIYLWLKEDEVTAKDVKRSDEYVPVKVCFKIQPVDNGDGTMDADTTTVDPTALDATEGADTITNEKQPGDLEIRKEVDDKSDETFLYKVALTNEHGYTIDTKAIASSAVAYENGTGRRMTMPLRVMAVSEDDADMIMAEDDTANTIKSDENAEIVEESDQAADATKPIDPAKDENVDQPESDAIDMEETFRHETQTADEAAPELTDSDDYGSPEIAVNEITEDNATDFVPMPDANAVSNNAVSDANLFGLSANAATSTITKPTYTISVWNSSSPRTPNYDGSGFKTGSVASAGETASVTTNYDNTITYRIRPYTVAVNVNKGSFSGTVEARVNYNTAYGVNHSQYSNYKTVTNSTDVSEGHQLDWWWDSSGTGSGTYYFGYTKDATIEFKMTGEMDTFFTAAGIVPTSPTTGKGTITSTMKLTPKEWNITYNLDGGSLAEKKTKYTGLDRFTLPTPTKTGYTFTGWTGTDLSGITSSVTVGYKDHGNRSYTTHWQANSYDISYDYAGGARGSKAPTSAGYDANVEISAPTRTGYKFTGWNITGMDSGVTHYFGSATSTGTTRNSEKATVYKNLRATTGTVKFTATWEAAQYTVQFDANGGSGSMARQVISIGVATPLNDRQFYKFNHKFAGWNTKADGSGTSYQNKEKVTNLSTDPTKPVTLYAQWEPVVNARTEQDYLIVEVPANATVKLSGIPFATEYAIYEQEKEGWHLISKNGDKGTMESNTTKTATFKNAPGTKATATIEARKRFNGVYDGSEQFTFILTDKVTGQQVATAKNGEGGYISFPVISYDADGTYEYTISEKAGTDQSIHYDINTYRAIVTVSGKKADVTYPDSNNQDNIPTFDNYEDFGTLVLKKNAVGSTEDTKIPEQTFDFAVIFKKSDGTSLAGTKIKVGGESKTLADDSSCNVSLTVSDEKRTDQIAFENLPSGTKYTIAEIATKIKVNTGRWEFVSIDETPTNTITYRYVSDTISPNGTKTEVYTNRFTPEHVDMPLTLELQKRMRYASLQGGEFDFELLDTEKNPVLDANGQPVTATNDADGKISFEAATVDQPGTYRFIVREIPGTKNIGYDLEERVIEIPVAWNDETQEFSVGEQKLVSGGESTNGDFINDDRSFLRVKKEIEGISPQDVNFRFKLHLEAPNNVSEENRKFYRIERDSESKIIAEHQISADSTFELKDDESIEFEVPSGTKYTVEELGVSSEQNAHGWITADPIKVGVTEWKNEKLEVFTNKYRAFDEWAPTVKKETVGFPLEEGAFTFALCDADSEDIIGFATNDADGNVKFDKMHFDLTDANKTFSYIVYEIAGTDKAIKYDSHVYRIEMVPTDDLKGGLEFSVTDSGSDTFINEIETGSLELEKTLIGGFEGTSADKSFDFEIRFFDIGDDGNETPVDIDTTATIAGKKINFATQGGKGTVMLHADEKAVIEKIPAGTHYEITEASYPGFSQTDTQDTVGTIEPNTVSHAKIENTYSAIGKVSLALEKTIVDHKGNAIDDIPTYAFAFVMEDNDSATVVRNSSFGYAVLPDIEYSEPGTYTYVFHEILPGTEEAESEESREHDRMTQATMTVEWADPTADHSDVIAAAQLDENASAAEVYVGLSAIDNENGGQSIDSLADIYADRFKVEIIQEEISYPSLNAVSDMYEYDEHYETVTVEVTDNGDGTLTAKPIYSNGRSVTFTNQLIPGRLSITKKTDNATPKANENVFEFTVRFFDGNGNEITDEFPYEGANSGTLHSGDSVKLHDGETITILDIPVGTEYKVYESEAAGFVADGDSTEGTIEANKTSETVFTNTYSSTGEWIPPAATKQLEGGILADAMFSWSLLDENGTVIQTKDNIGATVEFDSIRYDESDDGKTYTYVIREAVTDDGNIIYDTHIAAIDVKVIDNGNGTMTTEGSENSTVIEERRGEQMLWTNTLVPKISTQAADAKDGDGSINPQPSTITDKVAYEGLTPGMSYIMRGTAHLRGENGEDLGEIPGALGATKFTADEAEEGKVTSSGTVTVEIPVDATRLAGRDIVIFETCHAITDEDGIEEFIAEHSDIDDEGQTIKVIVPKIGTTAADTADGDSEINPEQSLLVDTVSFENLSTEIEYVMEGTVHLRGEDGTDEGPIDGATARTVFTPTETMGTVSLDIPIDASELAGRTIVVFERCYAIIHGTGDSEDEEIIITTHEDIDDEGQSIIVKTPRIATTATDAADDDKVINPEKNMVIADIVEHEALTPNVDYVIEGRVHIRGKKGEDLGEVEGAYGFTEFTAETSDGEVLVNIPIDATALAGKDIVVFEKCYRYRDTEEDEDGNVPTREKELIATHEDIDDEGQTITVRNPSIKTTATDNADGNKTVKAAQVTINDKVEYSNIEPGKKYRMAGTLHLIDPDGKDLGEVKGSTGSTDFTPTSENGYVDVKLKVDASKVGGYKLVAFETLYRLDKEFDENGKVHDKETLITEHKDANDKGQTVDIEKPVIRTGDTTITAMSSIAFAAAIAAASVMVFRRIRS